MEYCDKSLNDEVKQFAPFTEELARVYFAQISSAIYYLHCRLGIAHLDIKLANILLIHQNNEKIIKVTDFGLSRIRIDPEKGVIKEKNPVGTLPYMSPQVLKLYIEDRLNEESLFSKIKPFNPFIADIWSLGVCLYVMLVRDFPFGFENDPRLMRSILIDQKHKKYRFPEPIDKMLTIECKDIVEDMIEPNPHKRLTIQNVVSHVWFEKYFTIEELCQTKTISSQ